jgi:hypothetical protein
MDQLTQRWLRRAAQPDTPDPLRGYDARYGSGGIDHERACQEVKTAAAMARGCFGPEKTDGANG